jgi:amino acid transporter
MAAAAESSSDVLRSERIAGGILYKTLNTFDLVAIFIAIVLFITNSPGIAAAGPVAYIYLVVGFLTFLIPGAIVVGQLGRMFPQEGSIYVWTNKALGPFWGFFAGFCAWWPGIFVVVVCGSLVSTFIADLFSRFGITVLAEPWQLGLVILIVTGISFGLSAIRFRFAQNLVNVMFVVYGAAILLIGVAAVLWLAGGHASFTNMAFNGGGWKINFNLQTGNIPIFGFVILALLGIEVPLNMGVEVTSERAVTRYLFWGVAVVIVAYLITTFGIMTAVPASGQTNLWAMVDAIKAGFGPAGQVLAVIVDVIMIGWGLYAALVYNYSFGRMIFVSGLDRRLPAAMSKVNAARVPWVAVLMQSIIVAIIAIVVYIIVPYTAASTTASRANLATLMYYIIFAAITVIWCISMIFQFIDIIVIRYRYHEAFTGSRLAPDWVFYLCSVVGGLASIVGLLTTVYAPWVPTLITTGPWDIWIGAIVVVSLIAAAVIYFIGHARIRDDVTDEQAIAHAMGGVAGEVAGEVAGGS